jgi:hypothetical protein
MKVKIRSFVYRGYLVERNFHNGMYHTLSPKGRLMADTKEGIKRMLSEALKDDH